MKRLLAGFGIGAALGYGWRRLTAAEEEIEPSWKGTDNDPEDRSLDEDLSQRVRQAEPAAEDAPLEQVRDDS